MNRTHQLKSLVDPKNRGEQIDATVQFILDNPAYYASLGNRPSRVKAAAVKLVEDEIGGYHFKVIKAALNQFKLTGSINGDEPPFTHEELY